LAGKKLEYTYRLIVDGVVAESSRDYSKIKAKYDEMKRTETGFEKEVNIERAYTMATMTHGILETKVPRKHPDEKKKPIGA
jgi:HSP20 family molecular chaperone IbpA